MILERFSFNRINQRRIRSLDKTTYIKKEISIKTALIIYGIFTVLTLIASIFTTSISINENMQLFFNKELMMEAKKIKEFLFFVLGSAFVYFSLVLLFYKK
jgi:hypothetical protein